MNRSQLLENWIKQQFPGASFTLQPASADASFRRYFRVQTGNETLIVMDAPPAQEDCGQFLHVAELLADTVHVPKIRAQDISQGFLLLSDLGNLTYLQALTEQPETADRLYAQATDALVSMQRTQALENLPAYDEKLLRFELNLFPEWYIAKHLQIELNDEQKTVLEYVFACILQNNLAQPRVFVHRDYHSRNLMVSEPNPGILDFQDAVVGPVTYDLVSLFKDAYIHWDEAQVLDWAIRYWEKARHAGIPVQRDFGDFYRDFEWMGVQRHIKVLGIFARLAYRDGKQAYLDDMPLVMSYLRKACERYRELGFLLNLLDELDNNASDRRIGYTF
ncbi:MAG: phosphotransferase [Burkholderiales bacterium]|uniref:aminoglycoside phosphotransferase family protein n=1 Tax=Nitrosomonas sp. TaxID=42353 RepID=UPI001D467203|nr:phosphotransferase [Nitrosomonas sp.]MCB1949574.1 phosphotransferase [Nitrosomonas sp.]MCP5244330.1 phosphotransferase [Burkholderiales bacterium]